VGKSIDAFIKFPESEPLIFKKDGDPVGEFVCCEAQDLPYIHGALS
jgi:hypothetical protein